MRSYIFIHIVLLITFASCKNNAGVQTANYEASNVELREVNNKYRLFVNGQEFYIKGAGCDFDNIETLADHGANSFRTWSVDNGQISGREILDLAQENGLMVLMGLDLGRERHGYDYSDKAWVDEQKENVHRDVMELKDHPALLAWGIGNELNLNYTNKKVWDAVNDISEMIHEIDGNHPTTTMLAGIGKAEVEYINQNCKDLDFLSIQLYADIVNLHKRIADAGYQGPYLVTEWGATGHWEVPKTNWGAPIEQTSSEKAVLLKYRYESVISADTLNCLGSYVFLWGQKQERTPTWYGLFTEDNREMEAIDVMHYLWNNEWPDNQATKIISASIEGKDRHSNIRLSPGQEYSASVIHDDPDKDEVNVLVEIMPESTELGDGGDHEPRPESITNGIIISNEGRIGFTSPDKPGAYRLFIYVNDNYSHSGTVNIPFLVTDKK